MTSYARRGGALVLAGLLAAATLQVGADSARADAGPTPGAPLPTLADPVPRAGVTSASGDYVLVGGGNLYDESDPRMQFSVVDTAAGATVHTFTEPWSQESALRPSIVRSSVVALVRPGEGQSAVEVRSATTGELERTIDLTGKGGLVHADRQWALVSYSTGDSSGENGVRFVHADGSTSEVPGNFFSPPTYVGGDVTTAYVTSFEGDFALDVATGAKTPLPFPDGARLVAVGPDYLLGSVANPEGVPGTAFRSLDRATLDPEWSFFVPHDPDTRGLYPTADGVVEAYLRSDAPSAEYLTLRPVDTTTGERGADLVPNAVMDLSGIHPLDDGRIALTLGDTDGGRIGILDGGAVTTLAELPDVPETADHIALSGGTASITWQRRDGVWSSPVGGSAWTTQYPAPGYVLQDGQKRLWAAGEVVMSMSDHAVDGTNLWRLSWPGGSRDIQSDSAALSHGGAYVSYYDKVAGKMKVQEAKTTTQKGTYSGADIRPIDGSVMWGKADASGVVTGIDLTTSGSVQRTLPDGCANAPVHDVRGRFAWVTCGATDRIVDLISSVTRFTLPTPRLAAYLGNGYVVVVSLLQSNPGHLVATVTDLATGEQRSYGLVRGDATPPGIALALDDDDHQPGFAYLDPTYQPRYVALDWVTDATVIDTTAPVLTASPTIEGHYASTTAHELTLAWTWSGGATSFDVRRGDRNGQNWSTPAALQGLAYPGSALVTIPAKQGACFSARARDVWGNTSDWSPRVCQVVDGTPPTIGTPSGSAVWPAALAPRHTVTATATDDDLVGSYDVEARYAAPRSGLGPWAPAASGIATGTFTSAPRPAGSETCYRARARDAAGNVSAWSSARCYRSPIDDRSFVRSTRGVLAKRAKVAIGGTYLQINRNGAGVAVAGQTGRVLGLWILKGKGLGIGDVLVGGTRVARLGFAARTTRRVFVAVTVPHGFSGTLQIVNRGKRPIRFDAVAIAR